jgi:hypothetical protein
LRQRGYFPVIVRPSPAGSSLVELIERQICDAGQAAEDISVTRFPGDTGPATAATTLWDLLAGLEIWKGNTLQRLVLIFDQFEELFTLGWTDEQRDRFIEEFGDVVRSHRDTDEGSVALPPPDVKFVLTIREDFLGHLENLAPHVPQIMHCRFRLEGLSLEQAKESIRDPAELDDPRLTSQRFRYSPDAIDTILTFLRTQDVGGSEVLTRFVDPSQLQIVLQHIESSIVPLKATGPDGTVEITEGDLAGRRGLERIVGDFYRRQIESFPVRQREPIRKLCETGLISQSGRRLSLEEGEILLKYEVSKKDLTDLVEKRLVRSEPRVGSVYYELAHDTLTAPILDYRDEKQRAQRRRRRIVAGVLVGAAAVALGVLAVTRWLPSASDAAKELAIGEQLSSQFVRLGDEAVFTLETTDENDTPIRISIEPNGDLDATVQVINRDGERFDVDNVGGGGMETVVIGGPAARYEVVVSSNVPQRQDFDVTVEEVVEVKEVEAEDVEDTIDGPGAIIVYEFIVSDRQRVDVEVAPRSGFDAAVELIEPDGSMVSSNTPSAGAIERITAGGQGGTYRAVVISSQSSSGDFKLTLTPIVGDVKAGGPPTTQRDP